MKDNHDENRYLRDEGFHCPRCGFTKNSLTDDWCWDCGLLLPEGWHLQAV